jgi:hypothetical protein
VTSSSQCGFGDASSYLNGKSDNTFNPADYEYVPAHQPSDSNSANSQLISAQSASEFSKKERLNTRNKMPLDKAFSPHSNTENQARPRRGSVLYNPNFNNFI